MNSAHYLLSFIFRFTVHKGDYSTDRELHSNSTVISSGCGWKDYKRLLLFPKPWIDLHTPPLSLLACNILS